MYVVIWIRGQRLGGSQLHFPITGCWDLGTISQFEPVVGKLPADGRWSHLPSAHLPGGSLVSLWLFFLTAVHKASLCHLHRSHGIRPAPAAQVSSCGGKASALAFPCSGCTSPPPHCPAELSSVQSESPLHTPPTHPSLQQSLAPSWERTVFS